MGNSAHTERTQLHPGGARGARSIAPLAQIAPFGATLKILRRPSPALSFWISFFVLHFLLFLPVVLMDREDGDILPSFHFAGLSLEQIWVNFVVWRRKPDLLRFNSEIVLSSPFGLSSGRCGMSWSASSSLSPIFSYSSITSMRAPLSPFSASNLSSMPSCAWQLKDSASSFKMRVLPLHLLPGHWS